MIVETAKNHKTFKYWNCGSCGKLLGLIYNSGTVAIKFKDLMVWADGSVRTICRNCQTENTYNHKGRIEDLQLPEK